MPSQNLAGFSFSLKRTRVSVSRMACQLDLYQHPELLDAAKGLITSLEIQVKTVEGLERAKNRLEKTQHLDTNTLDKCNAFANFINGCGPEHPFIKETLKLSRDELAFSAIAFEERRLKAIASSFKADCVQRYIRSQNVAPRKEIFTRLGKVGGFFSTIYNALSQAATQQQHDNDGQFSRLSIVLLFTHPEMLMSYRNAYDYGGRPLVF